MIIFDVILPCHYCFDRKWLYYSCFTAVFLQLRFDNHIWCYSAISLLFLLCALILENDCIILVLQMSFYNSDLMIIFDVILPCPYCFYCEQPYWKMIVLLLSYRCLSHLQLSPQFLIFFIMYTYTGKWLSYSYLTALFLI